MDGVTQMTSIVLHDPVMYLETAGETSNLKDVMALMMMPTDKPVSPVRIQLLKISNGTIASYPDESGHRVFPPPGASSMVDAVTASSLRRASPARLGDHRTAAPRRASRTGERG